MCALQWYHKSTGHLTFMATQLFIQELVEVKEEENTKLCIDSHLLGE